MGSWQGYARVYDDFGLVWFDAHMDLHTPESSPSKNIHGMPVATLLGLGSDRLIRLFEKCPTVKPENVVMIGIRSYEEPEKELVDRLGIKVFYSEECLEKGA
mmetsp:Transcript_10287/g.1532  ORF Transcript_10287/g.1532 Transcript_10287/m.1532 type:complete len:102 (+) Transcript_10287:272-577(+)